MNASGYIASSALAIAVSLNTLANGTGLLENLTNKLWRYRAEIASTTVGVAVGFFAGYSEAVYQRGPFWLEIRKFMQNPENKRMFKALKKRGLAKEKRLQLREHLRIHAINAEIFPSHLNADIFMSFIDGVTDFCYSYLPQEGYINSYEGRVVRGRGIDEGSSLRADIPRLREHFPAQLCDSSSEDEVKFAPGGQRRILNPIDSSSDEVAPGLELVPEPSSVYCNLSVCGY